MDVDRGVRVGGATVAGAGNGVGVGGTVSVGGTSVTVGGTGVAVGLSLIHISEPTRHDSGSRMPSSA